MKLTRVTLPTAPFLGALNQQLSHVESERHGCELTLDPRTGIVAVFKGDKVTLIKDWLSVDLAEKQEDDDAGDAPRGAGGAAPRRGRPPKNTPSV